MKKHFRVIAFAGLLLFVTVYFAPEVLEIIRNDAFVRSDSQEEEKENTEQKEPKVIITGSTYQDEHIKITITEYREYDSSVYVADINLSSTDYLQTALAQDAYGRNVTEKTSEIALEHDAILAINGDYYSAQEKGYVLRNGIIYRDSISQNQEDLVIYQDGSFEIITEGEVSADELLQNGAVQILSFGSALVKKGEIIVTQEEEADKEKAGNPRTAIAAVDKLHYLFIVSDGRTNASEGLSLYELAEFAQGLEAQTVYNLDGGGSATMYFKGEIINNPTANGKIIQERKVSDIVFIGHS